MNPLPARVTELPNSNVWRLPTLAEFLREAGTFERWIVPRLIPLDAIVLLSGQSKLAWKTWLSDAIAIAVSTGADISCLKPLEPAPVLYVQEEGSHIGTKQRIEGLCRTYGVDPDRLTDIHYAFHNRIKLDNDFSRRRLVGAVRALGIKLAIFDNLTLMHEGDENKAHEMIPVVDTIQLLRDEGVTSLVLAHLRKDAKRREDIDKQPRGSSVVINSYDFHLAARRWDAKQGHIDLTVRAREQEELSGVVTWDVVKNGEEIVKAKLDIRWRDEGNETEDRLAKFLTLMAPGKLYSPDELRSCWGCGATVARASREKLLSEGRLILEHGKFKLGG